ncbi:hypothetical protein PENTCL1PPCAC_20834, partial [Pristionchus entomophagus]
LNCPLISLFLLQSLLIFVTISDDLLDSEKNDDEESESSHREDYHSGGVVVEVSREREIYPYHSSRVRSNLAQPSSSIEMH